MSKLDLDFSYIAKPYSIWFRAGLLLTAIVLLTAILWCYQSMQQKLETYHAATMAENQSRALVNRQDVVPEVTMDYVDKTSQSLAFPWLQMFSALEEVKQKHDHISLLNVMPDKTRLEVRLEGEAKQFEQITHFLNALKAHPRFDDVVLLNQYLVEPDSLAENDGNPIYTFSLLLKWRQ